MSIIVALFILLFIRPQDWVSALEGLPLYDGVIFALLAVGLLKSEGEDRVPLLKIPQFYLLTGFLGVILISNLLGSSQERLVEQFVIFAKRSIIFLAVLLNLNSMEKIRKTLVLMAGMSVFLGIHAILQATTGVGIGGVGLTPGYTEIRVRWMGDWDGPNVLAVLFIVSIPLALDWVFGRGQSLLMRVLGVGLLMLNVNSIYLTNSRGALLGLLTTATVYLLLRFGRRGIAVCLVFALVGIALSPSRLSEINSDESSAHERVWTWERGLQLLEENPVFGIGKGEFAYKGGTDLIAHNNFVQVFAETGLFGFFLWMGAIWVSIKGLLLGWWRTRQDPESEENRLSMVLVSLLAGFFATTFFVVVENELLYVLFAIWSAGVVNIGRTIPDFDEPKFERLDMAITFAGMICVISAVWVAAVVELI